MGKVGDPNAIVGPQLRVIGAKGLRVIDSSIMPTLTNANTNAPTIMFGEAYSFKKNPTCVSQKTMVKVGRRSEIPGSDDHSWVPTRGDAVPKCVNIAVISYTVTIPSNPLTATEMVDTEAEKSPPKSEDYEIRRKSCISDKSLGWKRYLGVLYTLLSTSMLSLSSNILKLMGHIHPLPLGMYGFLVGIFLSLPFIWYTVKIEKKSAIDSILPLSSNKKVLFFMWMRSLLGVLIQYGFIASFQYITVADARTILASSVVTVNVFGCICFGEKFGCVPILVAVVALCGIGVMTRPPILTGAEAFDSNILLGVSIAFVCMILVTGIILCLRFLQNVHHGVLSLFSSSCAFISILPFAIAYDKWQAPQKLWDIFGMLGVGISWFLGNTFLALALQVEEAGIVSLIRTSEVIFTFCWQMLLLQIYPDLISLVGAVLVVTGVVVVTVRKFVTSLKPKSVWRKRLAFLLL